MGNQVSLWREEESLISMSIEQHILWLMNQLRQVSSAVHLNERYLHHLFSYQIQKDYPVSLDGNSMLHPEWATYIKGRRTGGRYRKHGNVYLKSDKSGSSGFIDFAIGNSEKPDYAIEFKMSNVFNREGLIYDYMKLLDRRNPFHKAISVAVYYGHSSHSRLCETETLNGCLREAIGRLGERSCEREHQFYFLEIISGQIARLFECSNSLEFVEIN